MEDALGIEESGPSVRQKTVAAIRERVCHKVGNWLKEGECVQLALAAGTRDSEEMVAFLFPKHVASIVNQMDDGEVAITPTEWQNLFGPKASPTRLVESLQTIVSDGVFDEFKEQLTSTLRCTISETEQSKMWKKAFVQAVTYVAVHMREDEELIGRTLGNMVSADTRRLEELRIEIDDEGTQTMLISSAIGALADSVT